MQRSDAEPARASGVAQRSRASYAERLARVVCHIHDHLTEPLSLERLAEVAHLSPFHCHRVYHATYGESIAATVRRLRLERGAALLAGTSLDVAEVARRSGYPNAQSFSRAFAAGYGLRPVRFRAQGDHVALRAVRPVPDPGRWDVTVRDIPALAVAGAAHRGPYINIGRAFAVAYAALSKHGLVKADSRWLAVYYDDPAAVPASQLSSRACLTLPADSTPPASLQPGVLGGGPCAVLRYRGPYSSMHAAYRWLYGTWLQQSGHLPADQPVFEEYLNHPRNTAPADLLTDIVLPLQRG